MVISRYTGKELSIAGVLKLFQAEHLPPKSSSVQLRPLPPYATHSTPPHKIIYATIDR